MRASVFGLLTSLTTSLAAQFPCDGNGIGNGYLTTTPAIAGGSLTMNLGSPTAPNSLGLLLFGNDGGPQFFACLDISGLFISFIALFDASGNATFNFPMPSTAFGLGPLFAKGVVLDNNQWGHTKTVRVSVEHANSYHELPPIALARSMHSVDPIETSAKDNRTGAILIGGATGTLIAPLAIDSTQIFSSITRTWTTGPSLALPRANHRTVQLPNGRLLITGGMVNAAVGTGGPATADCLIYDPATNTFTPTGAMLQPRMGHALSLLADGRVFASGGLTDWTDAGPNFVARLNTATATSELWNPTTGQWSAGPTMASPRAGHSQTAVGNTLFVAGGVYGGASVSASWTTVQVPRFTPLCEVFNPVSSSFGAAAPLALPVGFHGASRLPNGDVLVTGGAASTGFSTEAIATNLCATWNPGNNTWTDAAPLPTPVAFHTQLTHPTTGAAIITGGFVGDFAALQGTNATSMHDGHTATILAAIGAHPSLPQSLMAIGQHAACRLHDGTLLVTAGFNSWAFSTGFSTDRTFLYIVP